MCQSRAWKNIDLKLVLWVSSTHILLAQGHFLLVLLVFIIIFERILLNCLEPCPLGNEALSYLKLLNLDVKKTLSIPSPNQNSVNLKMVEKAVSRLSTVSLPSSKKKKTWKLIYFVNRKSQFQMQNWSPNLLGTLVGNFTTTNKHHGQKSRTSNFVWLTFMLSRNGQSRWFLWWILGS